MAIFRTLRSEENAQVQVNILQHTMLFDYHASIYGRNFRFPSFGDPNKPLKFVVRKFADVDTVFVTNSNSIGVLFLSHTKIYLTRPVFEQLMLRYEELKRLTITYDEMEHQEIIEKIFASSRDDENTSISELNNTFPDISNDFSFSIENALINKQVMHSYKYKIISIDEIDLDKLKKNVVFIKYNQLISMGEYSVQSVPCGTFIGWCCYKITFPNSISVMILTSYSQKRRFSIEAAPITADWLIINRRPCLGFDSIDALSEYIEQYARRPTDARPLLIPVDLPTLFIEVLIHILSLVDPMNMPITIVSESFTKLDLLLNVHSEWLNKSFYSISEPFPVKKYGNLRVVESLRDVEMKKNFVFCNIEYYELIFDRVMEDFEVLMINDSHTGLRRADGIGKNETRSEEEVLPGLSPCYTGNALTKKDTGAASSFTNFNLKIEASDLEIMMAYKGKLVEKDVFYVESENPLEPVFVDSLLPVVDGSVILYGKLKISDVDFSGKIIKYVEDEKIFLKELMVDDIPIFIGGWFVILSKRLKFRPLNTKQIEYAYF